MKPTLVFFGEKKTDRLFDALLTGRHQDKQLHKHITRAIADMKQDPACGVKIRKELWPKEYVTRYNLTNLWKYDLPDGWRLTYTIKADDTKLLTIILEWFDHKEYERRFGY